ncbi:ATP-binding cassette domain-containing protein [Jannaschia pohangensis]|uniref:Thiamine transport system ATP-binding protein n=1 Tax=Jannaschia pohangensis TaxID=390807 RepID=A0A1I3TGX5_9RHOB|nr:ATP-binding cassette domain-containing protein [Jannaschia pohangensis]SFJ69880.1 thiamine transport system ATP-binding protein [Jannaschia pohangensis]
MLKLEAVTLSQGSFTLRADIGFENRGVTALMGASGSGKSTLLSAVAGFLRPSAGRITIAGQDVTDLPPGARPLSILFQDQNLFPHLTLAQNTGLGLRPDLRLTDDQRRTRDEMLERVGLAGMGDRLPRDLSGGQQSRAALARALVRGRPWLLLDEAFSALGPALRNEMLDLLRDTAMDQGLSVLMVTHDPADARRIADSTAIVTDGEVTAPLPTQALFDAPTAALRRYLGD